MLLYNHIIYNLIYYITNIFLYIHIYYILTYSIKFKVILSVVTWWGTTRLVILVTEVVTNVRTHGEC